MNEPQMEPSWTGLGVGTSARTFFQDIQDRLGNERATAAAPAVFCVLARRLSGGTVDLILKELPEDVRQYLGVCSKHREEPAEPMDKEAFYEAVADHMNVEPEDVRRILHAVFAGIHSQITERVAEKVASELPDSLSNTWIAAKKNVELPR